MCVLFCKWRKRLWLPHARDLDIRCLPRINKCELFKYKIKIIVAQSTCFPKSVINIHQLCIFHLILFTFTVLWSSNSCWLNNSKYCKIKYLQLILFVQLIFLLLCRVQIEYYFCDREPASWSILKNVFAVFCHLAESRPWALLSTV